MRRKGNLYNPDSREPFRLSRSRIENFVRCPLCFYLDLRLGVTEPPGYPFNLNSAVDILLKKEFDIHRARGEKHPLMEHYQVDAIPFQHEDINKWRENFRGLEYLHRPTNFVVTGAVDDVWVNPKGELIVVDYKATSKTSEVSIDAEWQDGYKRQMEVYQWLLRKNNFKVSDTGYFVYANGRRDRKAFDGKLEFDVTILPYRGNDGWIEKALHDAQKCLRANELPKPAKDCEFCSYREAASRALAPFRDSLTLF
ncbi:MAG: PD-(D/E)XK nuclease family protein [Candidatus Ryanbacteria bacterium]|nr:PD-(D/E)XK nuclease family protein [Candidatus Ryanbacteria bacterium]